MESAFHLLSEFVRFLFDEWVWFMLLGSLLLFLLVSLRDVATSLPAQPSFLRRQARGLAGTPPLGPANRDVKQLLALDHAGHRLVAYGTTDDVVDVGRRKAPISGTSRGSTRNSRCDVPRTWKMPTLVIPRISCRAFLAFLGKQFQLVEIRAKDLERIVAFEAKSLQHIVADALREVPDDARNGGAPGRAFIGADEFPLQSRRAAP